MKKLITISVILLFFSCGSRKVSKHSEKAELSKTEQLQSVDIIKNDVVTDIAANIDITILNNEFTIIPIDNNKPMIVAGKVFKNAGITTKTTQTKGTGTINKKEIDNSEINSQKDYQTEDKDLHETKDKEMERTGNYNWWWVIFIPVSIYFYKKLKK